MCIGRRICRMIRITTMRSQSRSTRRRIRIGVSVSKSDSVNNSKGKSKTYTIFKSERISITLIIEIGIRILGSKRKFKIEKQV